MYLEINEFLKVMIPLAEKIEFKDKSFLANSFDPVKQCINIFRFLIFKIF